jgi:uncharacterized cupin superfamily protein
MLPTMKPNSVVHADSLFVEHSDVAPDQVVDGAPRTGIGKLGRFGDLEVGVWEMTPGVMRDVESDEVFVVLSGAAIVEFEDDTTPLRLTGGDVVRLAEGTRTVWTVTETLRKVYLT